MHDCTKSYLGGDPASNWEEDGKGGQVSVAESRSREPVYDLDVELHTEMSTGCCSPKGRMTCAVRWRGTHWAFSWYYCREQTSLCVAIKPRFRVAGSALSSV